MSKKEFKDYNPALDFINSNEYQEKPVEDSNSKDNEPKVIYKQAETKSKKMNILIQPSVFKKLKATSQEKNTSMNELINQAIKEYLNINMI